MIRDGHREGICPSSTSLNAPLCMTHASNKMLLDLKEKYIWAFCDDCSYQLSSRFHMSRRKIFHSPVTLKITIALDIFVSP